MKVLLLVLDGWGYSKKRNVISQAKTPNFNKFWQGSLLKASGPAVGLPAGYMGNSEVGHLTFGAGRVVESDLLRINKSIANGQFFQNKVLLTSLKKAKEGVEKVHLMGLLSDAGVHSHMNHLFALLKMAKKEKIKQVYVHAFLDGRDTPPKSAKKYVKKLLNFMDQLGVGQLASIMGRYYAMDRDNRWSREHRAYEAMVNCIGRKRADPLNVLDEFYAKGETDEFIKPTLLLDKCIVDEHDTVFFFNFRSDRARELTRAFVLGRFQGFKRKKILGLNFVTLTQYDSLVKCPVAFKPMIPEHTLGEVLSQAGISQLRLAETEKWAHVTYFFNGLCECVFPHEHRIHIPSRKVSTYEKTPKMKVKEITDTLLKNQDKHDFFLVNFANADMVAHSGDKAATKAAVEAIDVQLGRIIRGFNGKIIVTADHGNAEDMVSCTTCHTTNRVPIATNFKVKSGALSDVAPTILGLFKIKPPTQMTGATLLHKRL